MNKPLGIFLMIKLSPNIYVKKTKKTIKKISQSQFFGRPRTYGLTNSLVHYEITAPQMSVSSVPEVTTLSGVVKGHLLHSLHRNPAETSFIHHMTEE